MAKVMKLAIKRPAKPPRSPQTSVSSTMFPPKDFHLILWPSTSSTSSGHHLHAYHLQRDHLLLSQAFLIIFLSPKTSVSLIMFPPENLQLISWPSTSGTSSGKHLHAYHLQRDPLLCSQAFIFIFLSPNTSVSSIMFPPAQGSPFDIMA